jgi:serine/threonine-protein kinase RsbW
VNESIDTLRLTVPARAENIALVRQALAGLAGALGAPSELIDDIKTAASEAATNVVTHAYPDGEEGPLEVCATVTGRHLEILVRDAGVGMQPRPLEAGQPSLRVGLALIGALADSFSVSGEEGRGTEVKLSFDLYRGADSSAQVEPIESGVAPDETRIAVRGSEPGGAAIPRVLEMLAARSSMTLDQLSDAQLLGDYLAHWNSQASIDSQPLQMSITDRDGTLALRIGPLNPGIGKRILENSAIPGLGQTIERLAEKIEFEETSTDEGPAEFLTMEIRATT